jgi:hypothetical protein
LQVSWQNSVIPGAFTTQGSTVIFTPRGRLPGAAMIKVGATIKDLRGLQGSFFLQFLTGANSDTTPPTLTFAWPPEGARVPAYSNFVLHFSRPMTLAQGRNPIQIIAGPSGLSPYSTFNIGEDSQTFTGNMQLPPDTDVTLAVTDLQDFAGTPIQPFSIHFRTLSEAESRGPRILSVSPANGAVNVDVHSPIEIRFAEPMEPDSVASGLEVTSAGRRVSGSISHDDSRQTFVFRPNVDWEADGVPVEIFLSPTAYDSTGARIDAFHSRFTTTSPQSATAKAISFSVSANAIDVRFAGPVLSGPGHVYLRQGNLLLPSQFDIVSFDQIRVIPPKPFEPGVLYHLVLSADQEIAIQTGKEEQDNPAVTAVVREPGALRIRFNEAINSLTLRRGGIRLQRPDGTSANFTTVTSVDGSEVTLVPTESAEPLTVIMNGIESRRGGRVSDQVHRP